MAISINASEFRLAVNWSAHCWAWIHFLLRARDSQSQLQGFLLLRCLPHRGRPLKLDRCMHAKQSCRLCEGIFSLYSIAAGTCAHTNACRGCMGGMVGSCSLYWGYGYIHQRIAYAVWPQAHFCWLLIEQGLTRMQGQGGMRKTSLVPANCGPGSVPWEKHRTPDLRGSSSSSSDFCQKPHYSIAAGTCAHTNACRGCMGGMVGSCSLYWGYGYINQRIAYAVWSQVFFCW